MLSPNVGHATPLYLGIASGNGSHAAAACTYRYPRQANERNKGIFCLPSPPCPNLCLYPSSLLPMSLNGMPFPKTPSPALPNQDLNPKGRIHGSTATMTTMYMRHRSLLSRVKTSCRHGANASSVFESRNSEVLSRQIERDVSAVVSPNHVVRIVSFLGKISPRPISLP